MSKKRIKVDADRLREFVSSIGNPDVEPQGSHLTELQFVGVVMESLETQDMERIDTHLDTCESCQGKLDLLFAADEIWSTPEETNRIAARLRGSMARARNPQESPSSTVISNFMTQVSDWLDTISLRPSLQAASGASALQTDSSESFSYSFVEEDEEIRITFSFLEPDMAGTEIQAYLLTSDQRELILSKPVPVVQAIGADYECGARVVINRSDLPEDYELKIKLL